ncbi:DUF554 domain-containing protein [Metabacillus iocasae]|uniref:Membrane protein YqgA involved in biofilm formation n=1 Tax=Priestia iocasae TaxID=2291674 RepID=A0ABS2QQW7_9BACI|nr:DUF554 domain-containing protein [Metabacillus iocasae]MBM7701850.1 putative membrane protein YqgA involved in biofilm formation [Metabacillus iocasae]
MALLGAIVNGLCIIGGTLIGRFLSRIPDRIKETVMMGIGLSVTILGIQMGLKSEQFLIVIFSLVIGAVIGEWLDIDKALNKVGNWLEEKVGTSEGGGVAKGFVTATLIFVIGAMAIIGALDSGIRGNHSVLYTKSIIDGFTSLILATTLGIGVLFSFIPVVLYEGSIALFATQIEKWIPAQLMDSFILEMTATGGLMIVAIGLNLLGITAIRVANLLPAILVVAILTALLYRFL